ncbi:MAG: hypothetical protein J5932_11015 [Prevotella sp.]|nr:hypothetical protein [Prevotella sp.]
MTFTHARGAVGDVTTNADIDFSGSITGTSPYTIAGTVGSMTWTQQWTYAPAIVDGILQFGNFNGGVVALQGNAVGNRDVVTIKFDLAFGKLSGKHVGFKFVDKDGNNILEQWFDAYNGDFDDANPLGLDWAYMYRGSNTVIQERCVNFTITLDYAAQKITTNTTCLLSGASKPATNGEFEVSMPSNVGTIAQFVLEGNINNTGRYSTLDNLKITTTEGNYEVELPAYAINYIYGNDTIQTTSGNLAAGTKVEAENPIVIDNVKYFAADGATTSLTLSDDADKNVLNVNLREAGNYTYNVYAVNSSDVKLLEAPIATATNIEGEESTLTWSKYIQVDDQWYVTSETSFQTTVSESGTKNVVFEESDVTYFYEMESLTRSGGAYLTETAETYSNGSRLRLSRGSTYSTPALSGGTYELTIPWQNGNSSAAEVYVYTKDANGNLSVVLATLEATGSTTNTFTTSIAVQEGYSIAFNGNEGSGNNNARMDYMTLKRTGEAHEQITINDIGVSSYVTTYPLDFSHLTDVKALIATSETEDQIVMTKVTEVPANTPIIVRGPAGTYDIPVGTCTALPAVNLLKGSATESINAGDEEGTVYALKKSDGEFHKVAATVTIPAKIAYFVSTATTAGAKEIKSYTIFGEDETAVSSVNADTEKANVRLFNVAGQQVGAGYKGLVIDENGNKYIK